MALITESCRSRRYNYRAIERGKNAYDMDAQSMCFMDDRRGDCNLKHFVSEAHVTRGLRCASLSRRNYWKKGITRHFCLSVDDGWRGSFISFIVGGTVVFVIVIVIAR